MSKMRGLGSVSLSAPATATATAKPTFWAASSKPICAGVRPMLRARRAHQRVTDPQEKHREE